MCFIYRWVNFCVGLYWKWIGSALKPYVKVTLKDIDKKIFSWEELE